MFRRNPEMKGQPDKTDKYDSQRQRPYGDLKLKRLSILLFV
jgi:hypothetical protein